MKVITIGGFMATGKSTVGKQLAEHLARPFIDLDVLIEHKTGELFGMNIRDVFQHYGETVFRKLEYEILIDLLEKTDIESVIALGGGTLQNNDLAHVVLENTSLFVLRAEWDFLESRIIESSRPLKENALSLYYERIPTFDVGIQIQVDEKSVEEIVSEIVEKVIQC